MKKLSVRSFIYLSSLTLLASCGDAKLSTGSGSTMSGVAATGAPISGGKYEIKGKDGDIVQGTTGNDGSYSANISSLEEPYLIRVTSPSGEKYISVASQSALAAGKKINVTPLSHTIVSNVFGNTDADEVFADFETEANNYSDEKLKDEKDDLLAKFVAAGLVGTSGIVGADVDLLNGELLAGTSSGLDGLLDVLEVNNSGTSVEIKLKGGVAIFTDHVDNTPDGALPAALNAGALTAAHTQLAVIDEIRTKMNALAALHSSKVSCNGLPQVGGACDVDALYAEFAPFFHTDYQEEGRNKTKGVWAWFCMKGDDDEAISHADCMTAASMSEPARSIAFENVGLKDITLIKYDAGVAQISFNFYKDGVLKGSEEMSLKRNAGTQEFQLIGNNKTFKYWIDTESLFDSSYNSSTPSVAPVDSYKVNLNFYFKNSGAHTFNGDEQFTLTATSGHAIFPGPSASLSLYLVRAPQHDNSGQCTDGYMFSTRADPYKVFDSATGTESHATYAAACIQNTDPCHCQQSSTSFAYFDYEAAQKLTLSATQVALMNKFEALTLDSVSGVAAPITDSFNIKKPLVINALNAATYVPSVGMSTVDFCTTSTFTSSFNLSVATGQLNYVSLNFGYGQGSAWKNESAKEEYRDDNLSSAVFAPTFVHVSGDVIQYRNLYLGARDEFDRQFVRRIDCH